jgi:hypothetical protein
VRILYRVEAQDDVAAARAWYEGQQAGLGRTLQEALRRAEDLLGERPPPFRSCTVTFGVWCYIGSRMPSTIDRLMVHDSRSLRSSTNGKTQTSSVSVVTSDERVLLPGGAAGGVLTRLASSLGTSLTHVAAGEQVARSRRANR